MNIFPTIEQSQFLVCEDVREEKTGKFTIVGLFPGNRMVLENVPSGDNKISFVLAFVIVFCDGEGEAQLKIRALDPDGQNAMTMSTAQPVRKLANKAMTLNMRVPAFTVSKLGTYTLQVVLDDRTYDFPFYLEAPAAKTH